MVDQQLRRSTSIKSKGHYVTPLELLHISYSSSNINGLNGQEAAAAAVKVVVLENGLVSHGQGRVPSNGRSYYNNVVNTRH